MLFSGILFLMSAYASCIELKYLIWGEHTEATIVRAQKLTTSSGRRSVKVMGVTYEFAEKDGTSRKDKMNMSLDWTPPADERLQIEYLPKTPGESRIPGERKYIFVIIFFGSLCVMGFFLVRVLRQAYDY